MNFDTTEFIDPIYKKKISGIAVKTDFDVESFFFAHGSIETKYVSSFQLSLIFCLWSHFQHLHGNAKFFVNKLMGRDGWQCVVCGGMYYSLE